MTDRTTEQPTDQPTGGLEGSWGSYTSNNLYPDNDNLTFVWLYIHADVVKRTATVFQWVIMAEIGFN